MFAGAIEFEEADLSSLSTEGANGHEEIPRLEKPSKTPGELCAVAYQSKTQKKNCPDRTRDSKKIQQTHLQKSRQKKGLALENRVTKVKRMAFYTVSFCLCFLFALHHLCASCVPSRLEKIATPF